MAWNYDYFPKAERDQRRLDQLKVLEVNRFDAAQLKKRISVRVYPSPEAKQAALDNINKQLVNFELEKAEILRDNTDPPA